MICKNCNTEHPKAEIANPHYCISRLEEALDKMELNSAQLRRASSEKDAENKRLREALELVHDDIIKHHDTIGATAWQAIISVLGKEDTDEPIPY